MKKLLADWNNKEIVRDRYTVNGQEIKVTINHQAAFIEDGIVNPEVWEAQPKKILLLLKEAYNSENGSDGEAPSDVDESWSLTDMLKERAPWSNTWRRVAEWTYGIINTDAKTVAPYVPGQIG